jgi:hypothetical protein
LCVPARLFDRDNGWDDFYAQSLRLARQQKNRWVVLADISDFYSQVNHHRVANALEAAAVPSTRAREIERLLSNWGALQSRGLPVGPMVSVPLAEACLNDVDGYLVGNRWQHTRYVDDFRIFCRSRLEANRALHDLTEYLFTAHRLALTSSKTRIVAVREFEALWLEHPAFLERSKQSEKISQLIAEFQRQTGYILQEADLPQGDKLEAIRGALQELFEVCLAAKPLKMGLARHLLRSAGAIRTNRILSLVLDNIESLTPVLRDVLVYVVRSKQKQTSAQVVRALTDYALHGELRFLPLVQDWIVRIITEHYPTEAKRQLPQLARTAFSVIGLRGEAQVVRAQGRIEWVRAHKETWRNLGPWDRRAIIAAGSVLPVDERSHWKRTILASDDPLDQAVAAHFLR